VAKLFRVLQRAARQQPIVAVLAALVFVASMVTGAVVVASTDDGSEASPPATTTPTTSTTTSSTTVPPTTTSTTVAPTTTAPPTTTTPPTTAAPTTTAVRGVRCLVRLHGKGGGGAATYQEGGVKILTPNGNAPGWNGRQWLYFPDARYRQARAVVEQAISDEGCGPVIVDGFSNGAAFAAKLYCQGETFDGRLVRVVVDDPVVDAGVAGCDPASGVKVTLYWTGGLDAYSVPGTNCADADWTCEGGKIIGLDAYEQALGVTAKKSPYDDHQWYQQAPELKAWT
jgi:hypothetical protein